MALIDDIAIFARDRGEKMIQPVLSPDISPILIGLWTYFNLVVNTVLLPILVATFLFSKRAKRHPTLVNVCITWIFSGVFSLLLFYAGQQRGPEPDMMLCIAQTSLLYGIPPMWSVAIFMMAYYMNASIEACPKEPKLGRAKLIVMLSAPYIAQSVFSLTTLVVSLNHPNRVNRSRRVLYCALRSDTVFVAMAMFTFIVCLGILTVKVYKNVQGARKAGHNAPFNRPLIIRVVIFGIFVLLGILANLVSVIDSRSFVQDIYAACGGTFVLFIFGAQEDVIRAWCFWLPAPRVQNVEIVVSLEETNSSESVKNLDLTA
ncbi:hypothetical protein BDN72DRAFT_861240 [Pluteus cervinus]|uniref:Uncharacterized protein n=1 Tax=Pluteus cervinus TaxID=181527 RepID=A0ACD3AGA6_9AGAR|nr:hypothetical protein BDN72DRAFT_861240 [Pluteus cervinus]